MRVEHDMTPVVKAWLKGTKTSPYSAQPTVSSVMERVPDARQRRRHRWLVALPWRQPTTRLTRSIGGLRPAGGASMFSALKFVIAGAIVALFGGFLMVGILTTPSVVAPAAVTESPSPLTTDELIAGFKTREVEPGVLQVLNDGARDFPAGLVDIVAGRDGSVWGIRSQRLYRIGTEGSHDWPTTDGLGGNTAVVADGTPWRSEGMDAMSGRIMHSLEADGWVERMRAPQGGAIRDLTAAPDGVVWAIWTDPDGQGRVARFEGEEWLPLEGDVPTMEMWESRPDFGPTADLLFDPEGDLWLNPPRPGGMFDAPGGPLYRLVDGEWQPQEAPDFGTVAVGPGGTRWLRYRQAEPADCSFNAFGGDCDYSPDSLAYYDGTEWHEMDESLGAAMVGGAPLEVARDGSLWTSLAGSREGDCGGIGRIEPDGLERYLEGHDTCRFAIAPDGVVWTFDDDGVYVILPQEGN